MAWLKYLIYRIFCVGGLVGVGVVGKNFEETA
jgi:hypothetical protein